MTSTIRTVAVDFRGKTLFSSDDRLVQVKEGQDFYLGQKRYVVFCVDAKDDDLLTIRLTDPDARCPYAHHHQPCECDGMGGGR